MGVADISRRQFLSASAATGLSLALDDIVLGQPNMPVPAEFLATLAALSLLQDKREKVPDDKSIKDAEQEVQKLFKEEYKSKKPEFADTLLGAVKGQKGATRYVVLRDAAQISSDNFKLSTAFKAIELMTESYQLKLDAVVS